MDKTVTSFSQHFFFNPSCLFVLPFVNANSAQEQLPGQLPGPRCERVWEVKGAEDEEGCSGS